MPTTYGISYNTLLNSIKNLVVDTGSTDFTAIFPQAIQYAESRCYRELDMLALRGSDTSVTLSTSTRNATCPSTVSIVEGISLLTPAGNAPPNATRVPLERASIDFIDQFYGNETTQSQPLFYAMKSDTAIVIAPTADAAYKIEITGTVQPTPMSLGNQNSFLGDFFPDLLLSAAMVFMSAWQRDAGSQMSPQDVNTWQSMFDMEMKSAQEWVQRQKSQDPNWNPLSPTPLSQPRT